MSDAAPGARPADHAAARRQRLHRRAGHRPAELRDELDLVPPAEEHGARVVEARGELAVEPRVVALHARELDVLHPRRAEVLAPELRALHRILRRRGDPDDRAARCRASSMNEPSASPFGVQAPPMRTSGPCASGSGCGRVGASTRGGGPFRSRLTRLLRRAASRAPGRRPPATSPAASDRAGPRPRPRRSPRSRCARRRRAPPRARAGCRAR